MLKKKWLGICAASVFALLTLGTSMAEADGTLSIGRREDGTTFDPIKTTQNVDFWVFSNVYDVLVRVDKSGAKLEPGLAESWEISDDGLTYTLKMRDAKFSDGSPITAKDGAFTLLRIRDNPGSLWADSYKVTEMGEDAIAEKPLASGAFTMEEWKRGEKVVLKKNPNFWEADRVQLDGVEWVSIPDDNTRMLKVQAGELDAAIFVPFSRIAELQKDANLNVHLDPSTREDHLLINHRNPPLDKVDVRRALDMAIDKPAIVDTATFGFGEVANSYVPKGALYHNDKNLARAYDPEGAKKLLADAGAADLTLNYIVDTGDEVS